MNYKIDIRKTNGRKYFVCHGDPGFEEGIYLYPGEIKKSKLKKDAEISEEDFEKIRLTLVVPRAKKRALGILAKRDRTESQLREQLEKNQYDYASIEDALYFMREHHYIDDERYVRDYIYSKKDKKSFRQIRFDLRRKGISQEVLDRIFEEEDGQSSQDLIPLIEKYVRRFSELDRAAKNKTYQHFARKGYQSDVIKEGLDQVFPT